MSPMRLSEMTPGMMPLVKEMRGNETMNVYQTINAIQKALNKTGITKDHKNDQQGYKFRGIDDVYNALSPLMAEHGLCILPRVLGRTSTERATKNGGVLFSVIVEVEFDFIASSDGSKHTVKIYGEAMDSGDKATNKALSAAYKYACLEAFAIPTEGDNDADKTTHEPNTVTREPASYVAKKEAEKAAVTPGELEVVRFIPSRVVFCEGKGKGAGKTFSEIYDGPTKYGGNEMQGQLAQSAVDSGKEINLCFKRNGNYLNVTPSGVKLVDPVKTDDIIEEIGF